MCILNCHAVLPSVVKDSKTQKKKFICKSTVGDFTLYLMASSDRWYAYTKVTVNNTLR